MQIASIILPNHDNAGESTESFHRACQLTLIDTFGGFTSTQVSGGWRDELTGKVYIDQSTRYDLAMDDTAENRAKIVSLARFYGHAMKQECVFVVYPDQTVDFIDSHANIKESV
jgi:hypothetical protein